MKFWQKLNKILVKLAIFQETLFFHDRASKIKQGHMVKRIHKQDVFVKH